jgi:hypothetical protein
MSDKNLNKSGDAADDKIQVNFYLSVKTVEGIDDLLFYAKKRLPIEKRRKLTKSVFYETCFSLVMADYNLKGEESIFWQAIREMMSRNEI